MPNFFYRQCSLKSKDFQPGHRLRNNAYVVIKDEDGNVVLPLGATNSGFSETYYPKYSSGGKEVKSGRGLPILGEVKIAMEGEYGSLQKAEVAFTCFDALSFNALEKKLLVPSAEITIEYGYVGPKTPSEKGSKDYRVYDYSFKITPENYFECKLKAVGKGNDFDEFKIGGTQNFPAEEFVTNYSGDNKTAKVKNLFDFWDWHIQKSFKKTDADAKNFKVDNGATQHYEISNNYIMKENKSGNNVNGSQLYGGYGVLVAPDGYSPASAQNLGAGTWNRIMYSSLSMIVWMVNRYCLNDSDYKIKFHEDYSKLNYQTPAKDYPMAYGNIFSANPHELLFPYKKGTPENNYSNTNATGITYSYITCHSFNQNAGGLNKLAIDGDRMKGTAAGILVSRDLLRAIQYAFDQKAKEEDENTEDKDKADGTFSLTDFFKKLFASIRDCSGGSFDLYLEKKDGEDGTIYIVNRKSPLKPGETVKAVSLDPTKGLNGVREISIEGKVPKDIQAKAFGGSPDSDGKEEAVDMLSEDEQETAEETAADEKKTLAERQMEAREDTTDKEYSSETVTANKSVLSEMVAERDQKDLGGGSNIDPAPYPLSFNATVDGIEGLKFGDTFTSTYLPKRYRFDDGLRVVFTLVKYEHVIKENDWSTSMECISRIVDDK